jgi:ABC-2 type transport system permease protein
MPMTTRAIKRKRDEGPLRRDFAAPAETAPSVLRADQPTIARAVATVSILSASVGAFALVLAAMGRAALIGPTVGVFLLALGLAGLLYHAASETDIQYRRIYGVVGAALLAAGILFRLLPFHGEVGLLFLPAGVPCFIVGLLFLLAFARHETEAALHDVVERAVGGVGALLALVGAIGGMVNDSFFLGQGVIMMALGLFYLVGYVGLQRAGSTRGYLAGLGMGILGGLMILLTLGYLFLPGVFSFLGWAPGQPGPPCLYFYAGLEFVLVAIGICSDAKLVVMTRRELAAYFYSPIAYVVLVAVALLGGLSFFFFVDLLLKYSTDPRVPFGMPEGEFYISYIVWVLPIFAVTVTVPVITMRLLSEEQRSGTLEVLLTAPVNEWSVALSKFFAALRFFLLIWYPWGLYLVALRIEGGEPFDYRPLLSFAIVLLVTGAHFVSLGVFCSSLTRSQVAAAILTFLGMMVLLGFIFFKGMASGTLRSVLTYASFVDLWIDSLQGNLSPRFLLFHVSATVFWLFLTVKVLEARKWR